MLLSDFLKKLGNENPIILSNHSKVISLDDVPSFNGKTELHFIPNSGGSKTEDITGFNTVFVDLDCGRDKSGNYYPLSVVENYKNKKLQELSAFPIKPSCIVSTRNGLQVFWFLKGSFTKEKWKIIQEYLITYFSADIQVKSIANQMRLPETYWVKDIQNKFYCKIIELNDDKYSYEDLSKIIQVEKISSEQTTPDITPDEQKIYTSYQSVFYHLTREVNLFDYIKTFYNIESNNPKSFKCICHNDNNPSANVFKAYGGIWLYCCRSNSCDFKIGNIVQLVAYKENVSRHKAIRIICENLNIRYEENLEHKMLLEDNLHTLQDIKYSHRDLYNVAYRYVRTLVFLHYMAIDNIEYTNEKNGFVFSGSTRYLAEILGRMDKKTTTEDINFLALLELIKKVDINSVSEDYKKMILKFQSEQNHHRHINLYSIPIYNQLTLNRSNEIAKVIKEKNIRKKSFSYETVANAFGKDKANEIFPQAKNTYVKPIDTRLLEAIEQSLDNFDYFTMQTVKEYYSCIGWSFSEKKYIRQLPKIIDMLNLEKIKATKELKIKYDISSKGYPYIYIIRQG